MFYQKVNKNNNKEMFEFLKEHFKYCTMNYWNRMYSIANNVKIYNLGLDWKILEILQIDDYFTINCMIEDWEYEHEGYKVGFNGRSGGYLVLYNEHNSNSVLDYYVDSNDTYEEFKRDVQENYGGLKYYHNELVKQVELVQDFDKLCDDLLNECKYMLENCEIEEKEILVPKTTKEIVWKD